MDITGFSGLQAVFGGTSSTWKSRIKAGLPVKSEPGLRSGKARIFDSVEVFRWLCTNEAARLACGDLDRSQEQAMLFHVQRKRQEIALERDKLNLIPADVVERVWAGFTTAARARLLGLPNRLAASCAEQSSLVIDQCATEIVCEALSELSTYDPADYA